MPQTKNKDLWVQHYREQLRETIPKEAGWFIRESRGKIRIEIKKDGIKLDDLLNKDNKYDLIKVDTQGSELDVIEGGKEICSKAKAMLLEVSYTEYNKDAPLSEEVINYMKDFKFKPAAVIGIQMNNGSYQEDILFLNER